LVILLKPKEEKFAALNKVPEKPRSTLSRNLTGVCLRLSNIGKGGISSWKTEGLVKTRSLLISTESTGLMSNDLVSNAAISLRKFGNLRGAEMGDSNFAALI
jgi:hypothetical protein